MSDWMDLKLAHSLAPVQAPDALWARINAPAQPARPRWQEGFRRGTPCAIAAAVLVLLVRAAGTELRPPQGEFVTNAPVAAKKWLAHEGSPNRQRVQETAVRSDSGCKNCHTL